MNIITFPLSYGDSGETISLLHEALANAGYDIRDEETQVTFFGDVTKEAVRQFQEQNQLKASGIVDEPTASLLNTYLDQTETNGQYVVFGKVLMPDQTPLTQGQVVAFDKDFGGRNRLGSASLDESGSYQIVFDTNAYRKTEAEKGGPELYTVVYNTNGVEIGKSVLEYDAPEKVELNVEIKANDLTASEMRQVSGTVYNHKKEGVAGLQVKAFDKHVGKEILIGETQTDENGRYAIAYTVGQLSEAKEEGDLQVRILNKEGELLNTSDIRYNAGKEEVINLLLPEGSIPDPDEYNQLTTELKKVLGATPFRALKEDKEQQDITFLTHKTGWDARLIAMVALADQYNYKTNIPAPFYYALFRAGTPSDAKGLGELNKKTVEKTWHQAIEQNVIASSFEQLIKEYLEFFNTSHIEILLQEAPATGISTMNEMLGLSLSEENKEVFADLFYNATERGEPFWKSVEERLGVETKEQLLIDSQLGTLTLNNAPLIVQLKERGLVKQNPVELIQAGLYHAEAWYDLLNEEIAVPDDFNGETWAEKQQQYAEHMAAQLQASFPTAVLAEQVSQEVFSIREPELKAPVVDFLRTHQEGFDYTKIPVDQYLLDTTQQADTSVITEIKNLQRVYQISSSKESMQVLLDEGLHSALAVMQYEEEALMEKLSGRISEAEVKQVYAKAQQSHSASLNMAVAYITKKQNPAIHALSASQNGNTEREEPEQSIAVLSSLEGLLGDMDYCECKHCRSVLSPAAYLVDLLNFIDHQEKGDKNPLDVLLDRRPDLQHLELTCENTNTVLPYVDLVNEILEFAVLRYRLSEGSGSIEEFPLKGFEGYNHAGERTTEELLASPQHVQNEAYEYLKTKVYPFNLPYNQPLEALRMLFGQLEVPLHEAMSILTAPVLNEHPDTRQNIAMESLGISVQEFDVLTDDKFAFYEYFGEKDPTAFWQNIGYADDFCRKTDIRYKELVHILKTQFINPKLQGIEDSPRDPILLLDPLGSSEACSFKQLKLAYLRDNEAWNIDETDYFKLMRFIRLWKKTGWSIEQTDQTIMTLWPEAGHSDSVEELNEGFKQLIDGLARLKEVMNLLKLEPGRDLLHVLALFGKLSTHSNRSLYQQLFLNASIRKIDEVFETGDGHHLSETNELLLAHQEAVMAAFSLDSQQLKLIHSRILDRMVERDPDLNRPDDFALNLENLTTIYRYSYLSRKLALSLEELIILEKLASQDPFGSSQDQPSALISFIANAQLLSESGFKLTTLNYYLRHQDLSGKASPSEEDLLALAKRLRDELKRIESENAVIDDVTGEIARSKMAMLYEQQTVDRFFSLIDGSLEFSESYDHYRTDLEEDLMNPSGKLTYNDFRKAISYQGIMPESEKTEFLQAASVIPDAEARTRFMDAIEALYLQGKTAVNGFFDQHSKLQAPYDQYLVNGNFEELIQEVLKRFKEDLKVLNLRQTLSSLLDVEPSMLEKLTENKSILHAASDPQKAAIEDFLALETESPSVTFSSQEASKSFYLEPPYSGFYNFRIPLESSTKVDFILNGQSLNGAIQNGIWENTEAVSLEGQRFYALHIEIQNINQETALEWSSAQEGANYQAIPSKQLIEDVHITRFRQTYLSVLKAIALSELLEFSPKEMTYFTLHHRVDGEGFLDAIPVTFNPADKDLHKQLMGVFLKALYYKQVKKELQAGEELSAVLENPQEQETLLLKLTGWEKTELNHLLTEFGLQLSDLSDIMHFEQVQKAYHLLQTTGLQASKLIASVTNQPDQNVVTDFEQAIRIKYDNSVWLKLIQPINDQLRTIQRDVLVSTVLEFMQQNEATQGIDTAEKLFEYLLIDVNMEACMKTSRIKQAISTTQLFINRCLMNLELLADQTCIPAQQWEWMKRYRIWEANRKVFLTPENWLEPELRDDKSPAFEEMESALLQTDITEEAAHNALLNYLEQVDEVSKLETCALYLDEKRVGKSEAYFTEDDVLHVIGKTVGTGKKYYYRRNESGLWTPWEKIDLDIEDKPVLPVVWEGRLYLFWLNILQKGAENQDSLINTQSGGTLGEATFKDGAELDNSLTIEAYLSWSEYYNGKWQARKTSDFNEPIVLREPDRQTLQLHSNVRSDGSLFVGIGEFVRVNPEKGWIINNKHSLPIPVSNPATAPKRKAKGGDRDELVIHWTPLVLNASNTNYISNDVSGIYDPAIVFRSREISIEGGTLKINFKDSGKEEHFAEHKLLNDLTNKARLTKTEQNLQNLFEAPFAVENQQHAFLIKPEIKYKPISHTDDNYGLYFIPLAPQPEVQLVKVWTTNPELAITFDELVKLEHTVLEKDFLKNLNYHDLIVNTSDRQVINKGLLSHQTVKYGDHIISSEGLVS